MKSNRILIVEDEIIIAENLRRQLINHGYDVPEIALNGEEALRLFDELLPDLILMDIKLPGKLDGIDTAERIRAKADVPIIYTTSYAGDTFTERAKFTTPSSYITKPYNLEQIRTNIELALHRKRSESMLDENTRWIRHIFQSLVDGVVVTNASGSIRYLNPAAEQLLEQSNDAIAGKSAVEVINLQPDGPSSRIIDPISAVLRNGNKPLIFGNALLVLHHGKEVPVHATASTMLDDAETPVGAILVFHVNPEYRRQEMELAQVFRNAQRQLDQAHKRYFELSTIIHDYAALRFADPTTNTSLGYIAALRVLMERLERSYLKSNIEITDYLRTLLEANQPDGQHQHLVVDSEPLSLHITDALKIGLLVVDICSSIQIGYPECNISFPLSVKLEDSKIITALRCPDDQCRNQLLSLCEPTLVPLGFEPKPFDTQVTPQVSIQLQLSPRK